MNYMHVLNTVTENIIKFKGTSKMSRLILVHKQQIQANIFQRIH